MLKCYFYKYFFQSSDSDKISTAVFNLHKFSLSSFSFSTYHIVNILNYVFFYVSRLQNIKLKERLQREKSKMINNHVEVKRLPSTNMERAEIPVLYLILFGLLILILGIILGKLL